LLEQKRSAQTGTAQRVRSKSIQRRQRILDAAARALAEHGYSEAKLSDIAQEAGTHAGSLYYYFPSREDLVTEVLLTSLDRMSEFSSALMADTGVSPLGRVLAFVGLVIEQTLAPDDHYFRAYMRNGAQVPQHIRTVLHARRLRTRRTLSQLLKDAQKSGEISTEIDPNIAAQFIMGAANWVGTWFEPGGSYSVKQLTKAYLDLVLNGVSARGSRPDANAPSPRGKAAKTTRGGKSR